MKHSHPLIFMRGMKSEDLVAIIDFLYCGEANVYQENLDSFLAIAEELQLKGLMGARNDEKLEEKELDKNPASKNPAHKSEPKVLESLMHNDIESVQTVALTSHFSGGLIQELDRTVKSMMKKNNQKGTTWKNGFCCNVCGKEGQSMNVQHHIESNHLEGISLPCNLCEKTYRSRTSLQNHKTDG